MTFTPPDFLILAILGFFTFNGFRHGFIKEAARIISMVGGFILAQQFHEDLIPLLENYIRNSNGLVIISYLIVFIVTVAIINILAIMLQKFFEIILLGWLNRVLGSLLGLIKGILIVSLMIFILQAIPSQIRDKMESESIMYQICNNVKDWVISSMSIELQFDSIPNRIHELSDNEKVRELFDQIKDSP